uniref:Uncharacterized protein n=1 Tax=Rhizophora mucronata TaxID=61149 RepID=A0A2P2IXQ6_RHIMU
MHVQQRLSIFTS